MKKILLALIIPLILLVHYGYYVSTEREFKIAQRAFTIGSWDACKEGPTILERYMSNLAYYHLRFTGAGEQYVSDGGSLVFVALGVSKCGYGTSGYNLDNERVKRGIELGLKYGEDINKVYTNGLRPLHTATTINNPRLIRYLISHGANVSLKSEALSYMVQSSMTPMEYAHSMEEEFGMDLSLAKQALNQGG